MLMASGLAAVTAPLQALLECGDHLLMVDIAYGPARNFCESVLTRCGVETTYYDPLIGEGIARLMRPNTKVVYRRIAGLADLRGPGHPGDRRGRASARRQGADGQHLGHALLFASFEHGVDVSIHAATKYIVRPFRRDARRGHHQRGELSAGARRWRPNRPLRRARRRVSSRCAGMRTLSVRLERHQRNALAVARWLQDPAGGVARAVPGAARRPRPCAVEARLPRRQRLFGVVLKPASKEAVYALIDALDLFGIGASWGGFESLIQPTYPARSRTATQWQAEGPTLAHPYRPRRPAGSDRRPRTRLSPIARARRGLTRPSAPAHPQRCGISRVT